MPRHCPFVEPGGIGSGAANGRAGREDLGAQTAYVIVTEEEWLKRAEPPIPLGRWLVENMPRIGDLELPDRAEPDRPSPFEGWDFDGSEDGK